MRYFIILIFLFSTNSFADNWATCSTIGFCSFNPSLPVSGEGPDTNIGSSGSANTNAALHIAGALAIPLLGEKLGGKKGKWIAGLSWIGLTLIQESLFHAPKTYNPSYPSEVRTDLLTRIVPTILVLSW